jgi:hypothetical protein
MNTSELRYNPVEGKTYTLFGNSDTTSDYYRIIKNLANNALEIEHDILTILRTINKFSSRKKYLKRIVNEKRSNNLISKLLDLINQDLEPYTQKVDEHLKHLSIFKLLGDRRLGTTHEQYHLYMLEIEITNRLYSKKFNNSDRKIALLPYCLQDFSVICKAAPSGFDYQCKHCSPRCFQNFVSVVLKKYNIEPYIWFGRSMKKLAKTTFQSGESFGVLGIACVPELVWGMRKCRKYNIPAVGIPINANRCIRWFGEFFPNSVDLNEIEKLVSG